MYKKDILIVNLGNADIQVSEDKKKEFEGIFGSDKIYNICLKDGKEKFNSENAENYVSFLECTKLIKAKIDQKNNDILNLFEFPIIDNLLTNLSFVMKDKEILDEIYFISTEQENTDKNAKDTIQLYYILKSRFKIIKDSAQENQVGFKKLIRQVKIKNINLQENPSNLDYVYNELKMQFRKINKNSRVYVNNTTGTSAMTTGLLLAAIENFGNNVNVLYSYKGVKETTTKKLGIMNDLNKSVYKNKLNALVTKKHYSSASLIINEMEQEVENIDIKKVLALKQILEFAHSRVEFDFSKSKEIAVKLSMDNTMYSTQFEDIKKNMIKLNKASDKKQNNKEILQINEEILLLEEVKNNAIYQFNRGAYTDFLGRVYRVVEGIYTIIFKTKGLIYKDKFQVSEFEKLYPEKIKEIDSIKIDKVTIRWRDCKATIDAMKEIIKIVFDEDKNIENIISKTACLIRLKEIRNKTILAHGYLGVSKEDIEKNLSINEKQEIIKIFDDIFYNVKLFLNIQQDKLDDFYDENSSIDKLLLKLIEEL